MDLALRLLDKSNKVAAGDVSLHNREPRSVFAADLDRARHAFELGDIAHAHKASIAGRKLRHGKHVRIFTDGLATTNNNIRTPSRLCDQPSRCAFND